MNIFLIGFMGAGKTTIGKKLASKMNYPFIDLDSFIEEKEKQSIAEIFAEKGEEVFREIEANSLRTLANSGNLVISTGGGAPCFYHNMEFMNKNGITIYIRMNPESLYHRLKPGTDKRPLLADKRKDELMDFISSTLAEREHYYMMARFVVEGTDLSAEQIMELIDLP